MTSLPGITVVVPCYNAERYIAATLESVLGQHWPQLEIIVVDDGSTDASAEIVSKFPGVRLLRQKNAGAAAARNHGIRSATHEWIAFLDADDLWLPGKLRAQWDLLQTRPDARMAYSAWVVWIGDAPEPAEDELRELVRQRRDRWAGPSGWIYTELLLDCVVWTSTVLMHRSVFEEIGFLDPSLRVGEDYDLWLRASRVTPILRVARPLAVYRQHPASLTRSAPSENYQSIAVKKAIRRWGRTSPDGSRRASWSLIRLSLARTWADHAGQQLAAGEFSSARKSAGRAILLNPLNRPGWAVLLKSAPYRGSTRNMIG